MSRLLKVVVASLTLTLLAASAVDAATTLTGALTVVAGTTLSVANGAPPSFGVTLNGANQSANYVLPVIVVDARGSTAGWNLTVTSTTFTNGAGGAGRTFGAAASTITGVTPTCGTNSTCLLPTNSVANTNLGLPGASGTPVKYFNATASTGRGTINVNATVAVAVPANVFAGSFTSTVTVAISSGP